MTWAASAILFVAVAAGCGGKAQQPPPNPSPAPAPSECGPPTLSNCPQDTLTDAGECPLPPLIEAQGLYTVGCAVTATCIQGAQMCVCIIGPNGPEWSCTL